MGSIFGLRGVAAVGFVRKSDLARMERRGSKPCHPKRKSCSLGDKK